MENDGKSKTTPQTQNPRETKRFEGKCFNCDKLGQRQAECRQIARDAENGTLRTRERQENKDERRQYKRKLVCQICGYTGHSAKYCSQRQRNASPYRQMPYEKQTPDEKRNQRKFFGIHEGVIRKYFRRIVLENFCYKRPG